MNDIDAKAIAEDIIQEWNDQYEYSLVYEHEDLEYADEQTLQKVYSFMSSAKITVSWE